MYKKILRGQKRYFGEGHTRPLKTRITNLRKIQDLIIKYDDRIIDAIKEDIGRSATETYTSEIYVALNELKHVIRKLKRWASPKKVRTPLFLKPGKSYIQYEPYGSVLILGSWNYPFQLIASPLIGAIAAGNCVVIKPSEVSHNTASVIEEMVNDNFNDGYIYCARGGAEAAERLLKLEFDYIFFTGSTRIGKKVMEAASDKLIPLTLELGGKCPCIVDIDADIRTAARRITWGKFFNLGQNCIAPDYIYAHSSVKNRLITEIKGFLQEFYGVDASKSPDYGRIIDKRHFDRVMDLIPEKYKEKIKSNREDLYIEPVIIEDACWDDSLMEEEIFGPVLPVLEYNGIKEVISNINRGTKPLEIYIFCSNKDKVNKVIDNTSSGRVTINDVLLQAASNYLPFGGVGSSGIGRYRGRASFIEFSNQKSVMKRGVSFDWDQRYPPYDLNLNILKKFFKFL